MADRDPDNSYKEDEVPGDRIETATHFPEPARDQPKECATLQQHVKNREYMHEEGGIAVYAQRWNSSLCTKME
jgi:hypothetical protein